MRRTIVLSVVAGLVALGGFGPSAHALPSYARQTGLPCTGCHTTPPELNAAGREFKLLGYVNRAANRDLISAASSQRYAPMNLLQVLPLGAWFETSLASTKAAQPGTQDGNFEFPQDVSLFLAGAWGDHLGSFLQVTYDAQADHFGMDNTDIRYANTTKVGGKELVYGITLNNNPTLEDLWNDTPAWGYPFIASDSAPTPAAAPVINGLLAEDVAGIGGYAMWDKHLYGDLTVYRSDHIGSSQPTNGQGASYNIRGVAPYWRAAWQQVGAKYDLEVGAYGMHVASTPGAVTGPQDTYTDFGPDLQYDLTIHRKDTLTVRGTFIHETASLAATAAANPGEAIDHKLNSGNANVEYHFGDRYSGAFGMFDTTGTSDPFLYAPAAISGSASSSPHSAGYIANLSYWPLQNVDLAVQYTGYTRFNGGSTNYDGAGRNASDNNTVYLLARFIF